VANRRSFCGDFWGTNGCHKKGAVNRQRAVGEAGVVGYEFGVQKEEHLLWVDDRWYCGDRYEWCRFCGKLVSFAPDCLQFDRCLCDRAPRRDACAQPPATATSTSGRNPPAP
jgi:hypothetical protein